MVVIKRGVERGVRAEVVDGGEAFGGVDGVLGVGCEHELVVHDARPRVIDKGETVHEARVAAGIVDIELFTAFIARRYDDHAIGIGLAVYRPVDRHSHLGLVDI